MGGKKKNKSTKIGNIRKSIGIKKGGRGGVRQEEKKGMYEKGKKEEKEIMTPNPVECSLKYQTDFKFRVRVLCLGGKVPSCDAAENQDERFPTHADGCSVLILVFTRSSMWHAQRQRWQVFIYLIFLNIFS